jgi:hypothetical protein
MIVSLQNTTAQQKQLKFVSNSLLTGVQETLTPQKANRDRTNDYRNYCTP